MDCFILSLEDAQPPASSQNPTNAVGGLLILSLPDAQPAASSRIPPTQLVDCSYSAYKTRTRSDQRVDRSQPLYVLGLAILLEQVKPILLAQVTELLREKSSSGLIIEDG